MVCLFDLPIFHAGAMGLDIDAIKVLGTVIKSLFYDRVRWSFVNVEDLLILVAG